MIKRILTNRLFLGSLCLLFAGAIAFVVIPSIYEKKEATTKIIVPSTEIDKGEEITEKHLTTIEVGAYGLPVKLIQNKSDIIGKYAGVDISQDDFLMAHKFTDFLFDETIDSIIEDNKHLITITLPSVASGLSSHLEKGDIVSVANFIAEKERMTMDGMEYISHEVIIHEDLKAIKVYDIENTKTESTVDTRNNRKENDTLYDSVPKTVTLIVTEEQAVKLVETENIGNVHLIFVSRNI